MTSVEFCYWLQGFFEVGKPTTMTAEQLAIAQAHLALVFVHEIDPKAGGPEVQAALNAVHAPVTPEQDPSHPAPPHRPHVGGVGPDGKVYRC